MRKKSLNIPQFSQSRILSFASIRLPLCPLFASNPFVLCCAMQLSRHYFHIAIKHIICAQSELGVPYKYKEKTKNKTKQNKTAFQILPMKIRI